MSRPIWTAGVLMGGHPWQWRHLAILSLGAARRLGLRPSTLRSRMKKLGIRRELGVTVP